MADEMHAQKTGSTNGFGEFNEMISNGKEFRNGYGVAFDFDF